MTNLEKFKMVLEERVNLASSPQTRSAYTILLNGFNGLFPTTKLYTSEEVKKLCEKSFTAGKVWENEEGEKGIGYDIFPDREEFIKSLGL
jgi:hypothetical protein